MRYLRLLLCLLLAIFFFGSEQTAGQSYQLELEKKRNGKIRQFDLDDKLFYRLIGENSSQQGQLTGVEEDAFYIDGEKINIEQVLFIGRQMPLRLFLIFVSVPIIIIGLGWTALGGLFATIGILSTHSTFFIGGLMDIAAGAAITTTSSIPLAFRGKQYKVNTGFYELRAVPIE